MGDPPVGSQARREVDYHRAATPGVFGEFTAVDDDRRRRTTGVGP